eukprot:1267482-Alexandrium_andersonii.AAC.1
MTSPRLPTGAVLRAHTATLRRNGAVPQLALLERSRARYPGGAKHAATDAQSGLRQDDLA